MRKEKFWPFALMIFFLLFIGIIALREAPRMFTLVRESLAEGDDSVFSLANRIDTSYTYDLLDFESPFFLLNRGAYIELNGAVAKLMQKRWVNDRVKLNNGYLAQLTEKREMIYAATDVIGFSEVLAREDIPFLYVRSPSDISKYDDQLPTGVRDYANENMDELFALLSERNIPTLDLREKMREEGIDHYGMFLRTDHHWKPELGFWAFTKMLENLEQRGLISAMDETVTDIGNYEIEITPDGWLGSHGRRTGRIFAGIDDLPYIHPKFETRLSLEIPEYGTNREGSFEEVFYFPQFISRRSPFANTPDLLYSGLPTPLQRLRNADAPQDKRILLVGDSFNFTVDIFLALHFTEVDFMYSPSIDEIRAHMEVFQPDVVIANYCASDPKGI